MKRKMHHVLYPMVLPVLFFINAFAPREVLGCRNRGLVAMAIALLGLLGAFGAALAGLKARHTGSVDVLWWVGTSLILAIPAIALIVLA
jgi:hypothetical protein